MSAMGRQRNDSNMHRIIALNMQDRDGDGAQQSEDDWDAADGAWLAPCSLLK